MKVIFKTESGQGIGFGHAMRCLALVQAFQEKKVNPDVWINGDEKVRALLSGLNVHLDNFAEDSDFWTATHNADVIVVDSYLDARPTYDKIAASSKTAVYLDDSNRLAYPKGTVHNSAVHASEMNYPQNNQVNYLLGSQYILLRRDFWDIAPIDLKPTVSDFFITFGGEDTKNLTPAVLRMLVAEFPKSVKRIVIGAEFKNISEIKENVDSNTEIIFSPDAKKMLSTMQQSDVAISAGGQTLNELARVGLPTILIKVADNQAHTSKGWIKAGFALSAGDGDDKNLLSTLKKCLGSMIPLATRKQLSDAGRSLSDGQGARRVAHEIMGRLSLK